MTVVDGGKGFCDAIKARHPRVEAVNSLFEDYRSAPAFQTIVMGHVLEHVENPVEILALARGWLAPGGRILAAVPNARSLHRQAATIMGLLPNESALNEAPATTAIAGSTTPNPSAPTSRKPASGSRSSAAIG